MAVPNPGFQTARMAVSSPQNDNEPSSHEPFPYWPLRFLAAHGPSPFGTALRGEPGTERPALCPHRGRVTVNE